MSVKEEDHGGSEGSGSMLSSPSDEKGANGTLPDGYADEKDEKEQEQEQEQEQEKTKKILAACETRNFDDLQELAMSKGGFLSDANRARAWPILLGSIDSWGSTDLDGKAADPVPGAEDKAEDDWRNLPPHRDESQVKLDVDRSFVYYPNDNSQAELDAKKAELSDLITAVLRRQPHLCYFQGYHDICQVFLLVLPPGPGRALAVSRLSALRIRDFMLPSLAPAVAQLRLIPEILGGADPVLRAHLAGSGGGSGGGGGGGEPYFALADTLTMFAHNVRRLADIARLFDALLAREPAFALYVFARMALDRRDELLGGPYRAEPDMLHFALSKLPQRPDLDLDAVVGGAARLLAAHPPDSLPAWRRRGGVSRASALRTARDVGRCAREQSLGDGRRFFDRQLRELRRAERCDELRRRYDTWPNRVAVATVIVAVAAALYMRKGAGLGLGFGFGSPS